jgi:molecular chaperone DnaK
MRTTIDFGIDLGTTNSSIAVMTQGNVELVKNNERAENTPSAVWIDKNGVLVVGRRAYERLESDPENAANEFKLGMGMAREYLFARSGRRMTSPQLSAEVLKSLKADVKQQMNEDVLAAVITVPAAFDLPQCEATREAAKMAGLELSPLLQEPVAAAQAYGFESERDNVFWLVYDLGGGTFDAAVVQLRDQSIQVVNHGGDNQLGGKLLDWGIVEELLIPALVKERRLTDFRRGNRKWIAPIAKLKIAAEQAKISLSRDSSTDILIDFLCTDDRGEPVEFEYQLTQTDLERLAEPLIFRSLNVCRRVLAERRLGAGDIEKLILVGGPTMMPNLRASLADELGLALEFSRDPLTVVAEGAAVFAATTRLPSAPRPAAVGQYAIALDVKPVGTEMEPLIGGRVTSPTGDLRGVTIEFSNEDSHPAWRSGKVAVNPNGTFLTTVWAEKRRQNKFVIHLYDASGQLQKTDPNHFTYLHIVGGEISAPPLTHSVGVTLANGDVEWIIQKGTLLPAECRSVLRTNKDLSRGQSGRLLQIPVVEGENRRADRNEEIGRLEITAEQLKRDIPAGSEVEFSIMIDASRLVRAKAYLPIVDEEFEKVLIYEAKSPDLDDLRSGLELEKERLALARVKMFGEPQDGIATQVLGRIDGERLIHHVELALGAAEVDPDAADKAVKGLRVLRIAIDELVTSREWPALIAEAEQTIDFLRAIVADSQSGATTEEKNSFGAFERDIRKAIQSRNVDLLQARMREAQSMASAIAMRHPEFWMEGLRELESLKASLTDRNQADLLITQARRAINNGDFDMLRSSVQQLSSLIPIDQIESSPDNNVRLIRGL